MEPGHPHYDMIENDLRYRKLRADRRITKGESLEDTQKRVVAVWEDTIVKESCTGGEEGEEGDCVLGEEGEEEFNLFFQVGFV